MQATTTWLHPRPNPTEGQQIALLALGGYGRAQMAPYSDVDLLFLIPWKENGWSECLVESMLYILWDLHLKVGHATRSVRDCLRLGREDMTIRTALLEYRFLGGHQPLADELSSRLWSDLFRSTGKEFVEAKLEERAARHRKFGARYVVEPDVKEGKGGLRDLQTLFWIAKYVHGVRDPADLVAEGTFTEDEFRQLRPRRGVPAGGALPPAPDRGPGAGPANLRHAGRGRPADGLRGHVRTPRRRALHAGLLPPRHAGRRAHADLPRRAGGPARPQGADAARLLPPTPGQGAVRASCAAG